MALQGLDLTEGVTLTSRGAVQEHSWLMGRHYGRSDALADLEIVMTERDEGSFLSVDSRAAHGAHWAPPPARHSPRTARRDRGPRAPRPTSSCLCVTGRLPGEGSHHLRRQLTLHLDDAIGGIFNRVGLFCTFTAPIPPSSFYPRLYGTVIVPSDSHALNYLIPTVTT